MSIVRCRCVEENEFRPTTEHYDGDKPSPLLLQEVWSHRKARREGFSALLRQMLRDQETYES